MNIKNYKNALDLFQQYNNISNFQYVKTHIYNRLEERKLKKRDLQALLEIDTCSLGNYLNRANQCSIPFDVLLKICMYLQLSISDLIVPIKWNQVPTMKNKHKRWTEDNIKSFLDDIEKLSIEEMCNKWNLKEASIYMRYKHFTGQEYTKSKKDRTKSIKKYKVWTEDNIKLFLDDIEKLSIEEMCNKWNLKENSIKTKYKQFTGEKYDRKEKR